VVVASRWALQRNESGQPKATLETGNDISARKRAEEMLRRSQATYLAEAQKLSRTGSFGWNASSDELSWSEETFRIFGYDPGVQPTVELLFERMHPDDTARVRHTINLEPAPGRTLIWSIGFRCPTVPSGTSTLWRTLQRMKRADCSL